MSQLCASRPFDSFQLILEFDQNLHSCVNSVSCSIRFETKKMEIPDRMIATLTVFKGDDSVSRRTKFNQACTDMLNFQISLGYSVLFETVKAILRQHLPGNVWLAIQNEVKIKLRPTLHSRQDTFITLTSENFMDEVSRVYRNILQRQRILPENIRIPLYVYTCLRANDQQGGGRSVRRRATAARVTEAAREIREFVEANPIDDDRGAVGPIASNIWARMRARDPNPDPIDQLPNNNHAFDQAMRLDRLQQRPVDQSNEWVDLLVRFNGSDPTSLGFHLPTLRRALGLPPYPLFDRDIFHQQNVNMPHDVGQDMEDIDHLSPNIE